MVHSGYLATLHSLHSKPLYITGKQISVYDLVFGYHAEHMDSTMRVHILDVVIALMIYTVGVGLLHWKICSIHNIRVPFSTDTGTFNAI